jgi:hypothetical protein
MAALEVTDKKMAPCQTRLMLTQWSKRADILFLGTVNGYFPLMIQRPSPFRNSVGGTGPFFPDPDQTSEKNGSGSNLRL